LLRIVLFIAGSVSAQVSVNVIIPQHGVLQDMQKQNIIIPDVQAYYDIRASQFIYFETVIGYDQDTYLDNTDMIYIVDTRWY
jgi:hypothetical protein